MVGLSCLCILWPACVLAFHGVRLWSIVLVLQTLTAVMSDHVNTGRDSLWHPIDKWLASTNTVVMILFGSSVISPRAALLLAVVPLTCFYQALRGTHTNDFNRFVRWHCLWHVTAAGIASWLLHTGYSLDEVQTPS